MPPILNAQSLSKSFGAEPLFRNVSFTVNDRDRIALIGPNGSGKSTLLRILAGLVSPDTGEVALRKRATLAYVPQESVFTPGLSVTQVIEAALSGSGVPALERDARLHETLGRAGFEDFEADAQSLSGGWRKRLAIAEALVTAPEILLLDEPTNHLDLAGIEWLEQLLAQAVFACVVVSHDRYFLENVANETAELARIYPDGVFRVSGTFSHFLEMKEQWMHAQSRHQEALENSRPPRKWSHYAEVPKPAVANPNRASTAPTNSSANSAIFAPELAPPHRSRFLQHRTPEQAAGGDRRARVSLCDERPLFKGLNFVITNGMRVDLVDPNGSGKTTLLRLLQGELKANAGTIRSADISRSSALSSSANSILRLPCGERWRRTRTP